LCIVARSIQEDNEDKIRRAGADRVISPYILGGRRIAGAVLYPHVIDFLETMLHAEDLEIQMEGIDVGKDSQFVDRSLEDCALRQVTGATILAIKRADGQLVGNPVPEAVLHDGDMVIALGTEKQLATLRRLAG
jgi:voltage-gated potassium channel